MCKGSDCTNIDDCKFISDSCKQLLAESEKREVGADGNTVKACKLLRHILENSCFVRSDKAINDLKCATLLRDIGKIEIPPEILNSPEEFSEGDSRWTEIKKHPEESINLLKGENGVSPELLDIIKYHHPWYYNPSGGYLVDNEWSEVTASYLIISVIDAYIGMRSKRARRDKPLTHDQAITRIKKDLESRKYKPSFALVLINQLDRIHGEVFDR